MIAIIYCIQKKIVATFVEIECFNMIFINFIKNSESKDDLVFLICFFFNFFF